MTTLDMDAITARQRAVLGMIAIGFDGGHHHATLKALETKGLIVGHGYTLAGQPPVRVIRWHVPVDVHIQWAEWCAKQPDEETP